jgi:hypothetical protein
MYLTPPAYPELAILGLRRRHIKLTMDSHCSSLRTKPTSSLATPKVEWTLGQTSA